MGLKRPFDQDFQESPFKHQKQLDSGNKLTLLSETNLSYEASQKADIPGEEEGIFRKFQFGEGRGNDDIKVVSDLAVEFETSAPLSWVTGSTSEEDAGSRAVFCSSFSPEYFEFNFPRRTLVHFEDTYSSLLNYSSRKDVPLGPKHQADVPVWDVEVSKRHFLSSTYNVDDDNGDTRLGVCVIPMPGSNFSAHNGKAADVGMDCSCLDVGGGSVTCVRHHVKEAREKLRETIGNEKFVDLGFCDMGEEVAHKWTEEEEQVFHEVVYSNPVSLGKKFWEHLPVMFPSRTKKEIVSYYFNVFMLRRRAAQNRSNVLEIDSDDDEWQGNDGGPFGVRGEDEDSEVESFSDQDVRVDHEDDSPNEYGDDDEDNDNDDGNGDVLVSGPDATEKDSGRGPMPKAQTENSLDDSRFGPMVEEDSCTSFEGQPCMIGCYGPVGKRDAIPESRTKSDHGKCLHEYSDWSSDGMVPEYLLGPCDAKVWDDTYSMGLIKGVDLLPTYNMIEEIFGPCTWNSKSSKDKSIS